MAPNTPMLKGDIMDFPGYVCGVGFHPYHIMPGHLDHQMQLRPTVQLEKQRIFLLCIEILNVLKVFRTLVTNIISMRRSALCISSAELLPNGSQQVMQFAFTV